MIFASRMEVSASLLDPPVRRPALPESETARSSAATTLPLPCKASSREAPARAAYTVVHGRRSLQLATGRLLIPASEVEAFTTAAQCAQALSALFKHEQGRIATAVQRARQAGWAQGREEGAAASAEALADAIAGMARDLQARQLAMREAVSTLALAVVHKLASSLGAAEVVPTLIEQALAELLPLRPTRIRVGIDVLDSARARVAQSGLDAEVRGDDALGPFDCVIESAQGQNVVGLETQLAAIGRALGVKPVPDTGLD